MWAQLNWESISVARCAVERLMCGTGPEIDEFITDLDRGHRWSVCRISATHEDGVDVAHHLDAVLVHKGDK